jgi:hypothetical protein
VSKSERLRKEKRERQQRKKRRGGSSDDSDKGVFLSCANSVDSDERRSLDFVARELSEGRERLFLFLLAKHLYSNVHSRLSTLDSSSPELNLDEGSRN